MVGGQCVLGAGGPRARELEEALTTLAGDLNAATCHLVALLGELDARGAGSRRGIWACPRCEFTSTSRLKVARARCKGRMTITLH